MQTKDKEKVRQAVRESYGKIAKSVNIVSGINAAPSCCGQSEQPAETNSAASCCGGPEVTTKQLSALMGYSKADFDSVPDGANV